jgi:WhiB family redox-sensing transcriptional regulator
MAGSRYDDGNWRTYAACRTNGEPDLFFPAGTVGPYLEQNQQAKSICSGCPVRIACLRFALSTNQQFGIWGGLDEEERRDVRRRWRADDATDEADGRGRSAAS